jgi:two-component system cell cycle sensor histidine kinase/response regulator CckA
MSVPSNSAGTVLLVDDARLMRAMLAEQLEDLGYAVLVAPSASDGLRLAEEWKGCIDVLLTDVHMPGMPGPELATELRRMSPTIRVVFMSGSGASAPTGTLLVKPFTQAQLAEAILTAR